MSQDEPFDPKAIPAPSHFMRARRPYLFSDSSDKPQRLVTREAFSHHLETLTNQKDETKFELLALHLCRKFISPNLRPQTGPTGGGDGKTDSETYPVSPDIALRWFVSDIAGAQERWAFAFSAKKDWRAKIKADVASIVSTRRDYLKIYFVTNQFVSARDSASIQDAVGKKYEININLLDRGWIIDRVFNGDSLDIAIDTLDLAKEISQLEPEIGPKDYERAAELDELEKAIGDGAKYDNNWGVLAEDCQRAAFLARSLEKPRTEVEGRYARAIRIARTHNFYKQELAARYNWAWTAYFWFDDPETLSEVYDDVEKLALSVCPEKKLSDISHL